MKEQQLGVHLSGNLMIGKDILDIVLCHFERLIQNEIHFRYSKNHRISIYVLLNVLVDGILDTGYQWMSVGCS